MCHNYLPPLTCLTAPSSATAVCDECKPCTCPTDADIDAALDAANDRLTRKD